VDLIVSDLNMPGLDGYQLLEKVKRDATLKKTPFVVYSGSSSPRDIELCYMLGANSYLVKPMTVESMVQQLKALVHYWLEVVALPGALVID
jgi:CheY-like chemotaxis protein